MLQRVCDYVFCFFFQAEDGIRDVAVTGVQTCALPISPSVSNLFDRDIAKGRGLANPERCRSRASGSTVVPDPSLNPVKNALALFFDKQIGRASCRERV